MTTNVQTSRLAYLLGLRTPPIALDPKTSWQTSVSWQDAFYGTGARQGVLGSNSAITHQIDASSSLRFGYDVLKGSGATPFVFDAVPVGDLINRLSLQYSQFGTKSPAVTTAFGAGVSYSFLDSTVSVNGAYGESAGRYHWGLGAEYNLGTQVLTISTDAGLAIGQGAYFTVQAVYNTSSQQFQDLDYLITARICECIDVALKYRQVRQEIWFEMGLIAFPETRFQFQVPRP